MSSNSYTSSSRYRQFSVSSPDILHATGKPLNDIDHFKPNYDYLASLNEINQAKFSPNLPFKLGGSKFGKFKIPQMFSSENILPPNDQKDTWINGVSKYFKPILNYINQKNPIKENKYDDFEILFDEIEINEQIGSGNQGVVFSGMYRGNRVAIKKLKVRDETEIKYLKRLQHPNIIRFIGVTIGEPCCIVMEYCSKGQLTDALMHSDNVTRELVVDWSKQIVKGMAYLHSFKIIHRDLKSFNILINQDNKLKICDFGNSKCLNVSNAKMSFAGTPAWMAAELIKNSECSEKIDIWSFGVVFWELLFCERPYKDLNQNAIIAGVGRNRLSLPIPSTCPPRYRSLMQQCWILDPSKRPDFNQILADLKVANKEFLNMFTDKNFIEIKHKWKEDIDQNLSTMQKYWSSSDEDKDVQEIKSKLEEKLQDVNKLLKNLEQREKQLRKIEKKYEIKYIGHKSSSNSLINSLSRRLMPDSVALNSKSSSLRLSKFVRNRSRRSYRLHYAQKHFNRTETKDAEIQTNFFDFDDESPSNLNPNPQYKAIDSGYVTSCLSTPTAKHRLITTNSSFNNNSSLVHSPTRNTSFDNESNHHLRSSFSSDKKYVNFSFRLHNHTPVNDSISALRSNSISNELPSGYLEASFENKLMLKKGPNSFCEYRNNGKFSSTTEESLEESDEETHLSVDSLNNNKYSEIYRPSSESLSSANSLSWETSQQHQQELISIGTNVKKSKLIDSSTSMMKPFNGLKLDSCKRMATINDESDDSSLTIKNSYVVIPKSNQNYIVLQSPSKDQVSKKGVRDSLLLYKNKSFKKDELF